MGAIISQAQFDRVLSYIDAGQAGRRAAVAGGGRPADPALAKGFFIEPTVFADVTMTMRIAREEIFGPVLGVFKWSDEAKMLARGQPGRIRADLLDLDQRPHPPRTAPPRRSRRAYVWINEVGKHFLGAPFGGFKQSGIGREECFEELLAFTQEKNIHVKLKPAKS